MEAGVNKTRAKGPSSHFEMRRERARRVNDLVFRNDLCSGIKCETSPDSSARFPLFLALSLSLQHLFLFASAMQAYSSQSGSAYMPSSGFYNGSTSQYGVLAPATYTAMGVPGHASRPLGQQCKNSQSLGEYLFLLLQLAPRLFPLLKTRL